MQLRSLLPLLAAGLLFGAAGPATAASPAETLVGKWTCQAKEGESEISMTLNYRLSNRWLIGEIVEDNGAALLDIWLDDGEAAFALRRVISYDATVEMALAEKTADRLTLTGEMRHKLGNGGPVREALRFTGRDRFEALWEADMGDGWVPVLERRCKRD